MKLPAFLALRCNTLFFLLLFSISLAVQGEGSGYSSGLLFQIHKPGTEQSYLFGTMHSEDRRVLELAKPVLDTLERTRRLVLEMRLDPEAMLTSMTAMILSDGRELQQILGQALYDETRIAAENIGIPEVALRKFKPWAVATLLSLPTSNTGLFLDAMLYQEAIAGGMEVIGLENAQEQLAVFEGIPEADQVILLKSTLEHLDQIPDTLDDLLDAYLARDLKKLVDLSNSLQGESDQRVMQAFQQAVVTDRNIRMVQRLIPIIADAPAVIAVGALHLPGDEGLLALLRKQGFTVEKVF
ncbi:MAG: TraB/GumN family protein [Sedimenticola sp.]|nr:MAG: TraB/GumN family protein [Sedimenticola sp.]